MGRSRNLCAPAWALPALALSLALAAGACSSGAKAHAHKGITAIQRVAADAGTAATSQTAMATAPPADAAAIPDYSTWSQPRLENEIVRLKKLAPFYEDLSPVERAELRAAVRALDVQRSHPVLEDRPARGSNPPRYPQHGSKAGGGAQ